MPDAITYGQDCNRGQTIYSIFGSHCIIRRDRVKSRIDDALFGDCFLAHPNGNNLIFLCTKA